MTGNLASAEERLSTLSVRALTILDSASVTCARLNLYTHLDQSDSAVAVGLDYLRRFDRQWRLPATAEDVHRDYDHLWRVLDDRPIEALLDLPPMTDPGLVCDDGRPHRAFVAGFVHRRKSFPSCRRPYGDPQPGAWQLRRIMSRLRLARRHPGDRISETTKRGFASEGLASTWSRDRGSIALAPASTWSSPSTSPTGRRTFRMGRCLLRRAFDTALRAGDLSYAVYSRIDLVTNLLAAGDPLGDVQREAENGLDIVRGVRFGLVVDVAITQLRLIRILRGRDAGFHILRRRAIRRGPVRAASGERSSAG